MKQYKEDSPKMYGLRDLTYGERLSKLNRESLEERRLKADLALVYCSLHEKCAVQFSQLFVTAKSCTIEDTRLNCVNLIVILIVGCFHLDVE